MSWIGIAAALYLLFWAYAWFVSERAMFQPHPASPDRPAGLLEVATADGERVTAVYLPAGDTALTVLYSHGNAEDLGDLMPGLEQYRRHGYSVFAYDYRGYGFSTGRPSERGAYADIAAAYGFLTTQLRVAPRRILVWGRSIGSGPSAWLAAREPVAGLVLESAFVSAIRTVTQVRLLPFDRFDNARRIRSVTCPVLVMHGRRDMVVPLWHGTRLFRLAREPKRCAWLDTDHNDVMEAGGEEFWRAAGEFAALVARHQAGR